MPRLTIKHENTIMYKLVCNDLNIKDLYVGQTTNFTVRKNNHKKSCCKDIYKNHHYKVYQFIRANGGWDNWSMVEIEKFTCNDSNEAHKRERFWIETLNASLNSNLPSRTDYESNLQWREKNRAFLVEYNTNYRLANYDRLYEKFNCNCGGKYTLLNKLQHSKSQIHLAYVENPELPIIIIPGIDCPCGGRYESNSKAEKRHSKSLKHIKYLDTIDPLV